MCYLSKKPTGKWSQKRLEQRKEKMFGKREITTQQHIDKIAMPLKIQQAKKRGEIYE